MSAPARTASWSCSDRVRHSGRSDWCTFDQTAACVRCQSNYLLAGLDGGANLAGGRRKPALLRVFGRSGVVAVDRNGLVSISLDDGATGEPQLAALKEPMRVNSTTPMSHAARFFRRGKEGFYLYSRADLKQSRFVPYAGDGVRHIDPPVPAACMVSSSRLTGLLVAAHPSDLIITTTSTSGRRRRPGRREIPAEFCPHFLPEQSGTSVRVVCTQGQFRSMDLGQT